MARDLKYKISAEDNFSGVTSRAEKSFEGVSKSAKSATDSLSGISGATDSAGGSMSSFESTTGISGATLGKFAVIAGTALVAVKAFQLGVSVVTAVLRTFFSMLSEGIGMFAQTEKSFVTLGITAKRFGEDAFAATETARNLSQTLGIDLAASANGLTNLMKSGLNLEMATELMKRFTNEAITGKRESLSLSDAVGNLTDMYYLEMSALGNMSGIGENVNTIIERGETIMRNYTGAVNENLGVTNEMVFQIEAARQHFEDQGLAIDYTNESLNKYVGMISLTNETLGSSEALMDTYSGQQIRMQTSTDMLKIALGGLGATFLSTSGLMQTQTQILNGLTGVVQKFAPYVYGLASALGETLKTEINEVTGAFQILTDRVGGQEQALISVTGFIYGAASLAIQFLSNGIQILIGTVEGAIGVFEWYKGVLQTVVDTTANGAQAIVNAFVGVHNAIARTAQSIANVIVHAFESAVNYVIKGLNSLADKANKIISKLNKIPGTNIAKVGKVSEVRFGRFQGAGEMTAPDVRSGVSSIMSNATGLTAMKVGGAIMKGLETEIAQRAEDFEAMDMSFLDGISEGKAFPGSGGGGGDSVGNAAKKAEDKAKKELEVKEKEMQEKKKMEQELADSIREMKIESIDDDEKREVEMARFRHELEQRAMLDRLIDSKASEDQINTYKLASEDDLQRKISGIRKKYRDAEKKEREKRRAEEKREAEQDAREQQRLEEQRKREAELKERERQRALVEEERQRRKEEDRSFKVREQQAQAIVDEKKREIELAKIKAEQEIINFQREGASFAQLQQFKEARVRELERTITEIKREETQKRRNEEKQDVVTNVKIDQLVKNLNLPAGSNTTSAMEALKRLFSSNLKDFIQGSYA